jgi:DNA-binding CsgD family transcriptional regulator
VPLRLDWIRLIEACYASAPDERAWLAGLAEPLAPLARGMPATAYTFRVAGGRLRIDTIWPRALEPGGSIWEAASPEVIRTWYSGVPPVNMASRLIARISPRLFDQIRPLFDRMGVREAVGIVAREPDGSAVTLTVPFTEPRRLPPRTLHQLGRVAAHLSTALRLRRRVAGDATPDSDDVDAILDPAGRVQHAARAAEQDAAVRESLAAAVRRVERARGKLRRVDEGEAIELWRALVDGRWSLVDHVEKDGRRLVLARRNEPGARDPKALSPRERDVLAYAALGHSNKHIAYLLGLAPATVASHLASGTAKLGLRSRREVIEVLAPLVSR